MKQYKLTQRMFWTNRIRKITFTKFCMRKDKGHKMEHTWRGSTRMEGSTRPTTGLVPGENKGGVLKECVWTPLQITLDMGGDETPNSFTAFLGLDDHFLLLGMTTSSIGGGFKGSTGAKEDWRSIGRVSKPTLGITTSKDGISGGQETVALTLHFHRKHIEDST